MEFDTLVDAASAVFVFGSLAALSLVMRLRADGLRLVYELSLPMGLIGFLIGVIGMLAAESNSAQIAPAIAIAILTVVYGAIVRLLLCETESFGFPTESASRAAKMLGSIAMAAMSLWAMFAVAKGNVSIYWYPQVALLLIGVAILVFLVSRALGQHYQTGWAAKLTTIGWIGFSFGVVGGLPQLENPELLGPAIAFSFTSLLYALIAMVFGLIWAPSAMSARDGALRLGVGFAAATTVSALAVLTALVLALP